MRERGEILATPGKREEMEKEEEEEKEDADGNGGQHTSRIVLNFLDLESAVYSRTCTVVHVQYGLQGGGEGG